MRASFLLSLLLAVSGSASDFRGSQFIAIHDFETFQRTARSNEFVSPKLSADIWWNELVPSWNFRGSGGLGVEIKAFSEAHETGWYHLGKWSLDSAAHSRESVNHQRDDHGRVATDILKLREPAKEFQIRLTLASASELSSLKFFSVALADRRLVPEPLDPNRRAWGKVLAVPERSQVAYPEGINEWCSPAATSMLLSYWAGKLERSDLEYDLPKAARAVDDPAWPGTGNWSFNMAFAGAHRGIRACVSRFSDVSELEDWIEAGFPVAISVSYGLLQGLTEPGNGHLVVCIGFDKDGNIVVNDPGRTKVRQTYQRDNLIRAWERSGRTVYLVYPEGARLPRDRFGHWGG